ncbi:MAG: OmpA family protein [Pseudomonadota bacterium]
MTSAAAGAALLAIVLFLGLFRFPERVEGHLLESAQGSLTAAGADWATLTVSGRDLTLSGAPPDAEAHVAALAALNDLGAVRRVVDATGRTTPAAPANAAPAAAAPAPATPTVSLSSSSERSPEQASRLCQATFAALLTDERVRFVPGKALVSLESADLLQQVAQAAERCSHARLEVAAHTAASDDPADDFSRSQAQADAIVDYLVSQGVAAARLDARGYGSQAPIASNRDDAGRARNRRIEITVLQAAP